MSWIEKDNALHKTFVFKDFQSAIAFMATCAPEIDKLNHHPNWSNVYNRVACALCTHDAGNIVTEKDHQLAELLDRKFEAQS